MSSLHPLLTKWAVHKTKLDSVLPLEVKDFLNTVHMEDVVTLKLDTRFLLKDIGVASSTALFTINILRKLIFTLFNALRVKTRHAVCLIGKTSANVATFVYFVT